LAWIPYQGDVIAMSSIGGWKNDAAESVLAFDDPGITEAVGRVHRPIFAVQQDDRVGFTNQGHAELGDTQSGSPLMGLATACQPSSLGDPTFAADHGLRFNYVAGAMAGGIASVELVQAMARGGMLGFFGAAGLPFAEIDTAIERLSTTLLDRPWGANLIHSPYEPQLEALVADLYIRRGVGLISASAYLDLTLPLLRYRLHGIERRVDGRVVTPHRVVAKVSRVEVAQKFLSPAPTALLKALVEAGDLSAAQAELAETLPVATDLTVEADSGGHTDNRPALTLLPTMISLRDRMQSQHGFATCPRVGAAGGIGTPHAAAAAFAMGAAFIVTGTINQACVEAGTSDDVRQMLAEAGQADVAMAPAADMFEMGVELQVLRRGTLFAVRARKLWALYRAHDSLEAIPTAARQSAEKTIFRRPLSEVWSETQTFWAGRDEAQIERAQRDPKHKMALCFRWYLGQASRWANQGVADRKADYQIWCGPAIGAFNEWTRGSFLQDWERRRVAPLALNLLHGAAVLTRAAMLRSQGVSLRPQHLDASPRPVAELEEFGL